MKLASMKRGRDGRLVVVSDDLHWCVDASPVAATLQQALDDWRHCGPLLEGMAQSLAHGSVPRERFHERDAAAPLPRSYQWVDGSAYVNHVELVRKARGAELPASFWTDPLMYQGGSDGLMGARDPIALADEAWGLDFEAEVAVILDDVRQGADAEEGAAAIRLVMLCNDISLRELIPGELAKGFGFFQSKPASAFSPVAVTPTALGPAWDGRKLHLPLRSSVNGAVFGAPNAGEDMTFDFGQLIAHAAKTRCLAAGTILGSGTVSNRGPEGSPGKPMAQGGRGYSCIAEQRMVETLHAGAAVTPFLRWGDRVEIEMVDANGRSIFGRIDQSVVRH